MPDNAIQAALAALAEIMLPDGAAVLDPDALAAALAEWHARRDRLAEDEQWDWPGNLTLRDAILDLLLVFEDEIVYQRHREQAEAAGDQADRRDWQEGLDRCEGLRRALAERIVTLTRSR
jgi:hypothetical protein